MRFIAYILYRDNIIKVSCLDLSTQDKRQNFFDHSQTSGGFLFFSYNKSSDTTKDSSAASFQCANDGMVVRIPGPQILCYIQQIMPADASMAYMPTESLGQDFFLPDEEREKKKRQGVPKRSTASLESRPGPADEYKMDYFQSIDGSEADRTIGSGGSGPQRKARGVAPSVSSHAENKSGGLEPDKEGEDAAKA